MSQYYADCVGLPSVSGTPTQNLRRMLVMAPKAGYQLSLIRTDQTVVGDSGSWTYQNFKNRYHLSNPYNAQY